MSDIITAGDLLMHALRRLGCNGLASDECGCGLDDLAPCGGDPLRCLPARSTSTLDGQVWKPVALMKRTTKKSPAATAVR